MSEFCEILTDVRQNKGIKQHELGKLLYVSSGTISNYENGVHFPDVPKLIKLADILEVSTDYLLGRCSMPTSTDILSELIIDDVTIDDVIHTLQGMSPERKRAFLILLKDSKLATDIDGLKEKKEKV